MEKILLKNFVDGFLLVISEQLVLDRISVPQTTKSFELATQNILLPKQKQNLKRVPRDIFVVV